ncbi:PHD finger protein 1 [Sarcoptes scabiei]|uniref:Integrator complex subunit 12 n=1 Tax=Sarcoptes scabiei TaxID=52283 RepID=A0A131ZYG3_SARSC|nr:PHD finger protein 1 [Sarcoptes scabiei]
MEIELEDFTKGLQLLRSRMPDSSDELKRLLDHYINKKLHDHHGPRKPKEQLRCEEKKMKIFDDDSEATDIEDNESNETSVSIINVCVCCRQPQSTVTNRIIECNECKSCYHMECHKPSIPKKELTDPRAIWYCFKCRDLNKKIGPKISGIPSTALGKGGGSAVFSPSINQGILNLSSNSNPLPISKDFINVNKQQSTPSILTFSNEIRPIASSPSPSNLASMKRINNKTLPYPIMKPTSNSNISNSMSSISMSANRSTVNIANVVGSKPKGSISNQSSMSSSLHSAGYASLNSVTVEKRLANMKKSKTAAKYS